MFIRPVSLAFSGVFLGALALSPAPAAAVPSGLANHSPEVALTQNVGYYERRRWWRRDRDNVHVRAPFASVDDSPRGTAVDAPFTSVQTSRRGTWVRAPFVNLFVPRD